MLQLDLTPAQGPAIGRVIDADTFIRTILLAAVFLMLWISFRPFESLADAQGVTAAGNLANQIGYSLLFVALAAWSLAHQPRRLLLLPGMSSITCRAVIATPLHISSCIAKPTRAVPWGEKPFGVFTPTNTMD